MLQNKLHVFCCPFFLTLNEKIKAWSVRFPAKENPNIEKALFDWTIVLQYDVKAKYLLISRKFSGIKFFQSPERSLNQPKPTRAYIRSINQSNCSISIRLLFCFVRPFLFQGHMKIALINYFSQKMILKSRGKNWR